MDVGSYNLSPPYFSPLPVARDGFVWVKDILELIRLWKFGIATQVVGLVRAVQVLPAPKHADHQEAGERWGGGGLLRIVRLSGRSLTGTNESTIWFDLSSFQVSTAVRSCISWRFYYTTICGHTGLGKRVVPTGWLSHRKWRKTKQQPSRASSGHQLSCCLVSLHFLWDILSGRHVHVWQTNVS